MFYKIHCHLVNIHEPQLISPATSIGKHDHQLKYAIPVADMDSYKFSFYPRSIRLWYQLPYTAVFTASPVAFQAIALPSDIGMMLPIGSKMLQLISTVFLRTIIVLSCCVLVIFFVPLSVTTRLPHNPSVAWMEVI